MSLTVLDTTVTISGALHVELYRSAQCEGIERPDLFS